MNEELTALDIIKKYELLSVFKDNNSKCFVIFTGKHGFENKTEVEISQEEYNILIAYLIRDANMIKTTLAIKSNT